MKRKRALFWWAIGILCVFVIALGFMRWAMIQPYAISSSSMEPTLKSGDRVIVNRLAYRNSIPVRGDIVVFAFPKDPKRTFVKRVIALPGETVEIRGNQVFINGGLVREPYLEPGDYPPYGPEKIQTGKVLVLGDNRRQSEDSRAWGLLSQDAIIGKVLMVYYPLQRWKFF